MKIFQICSGVPDSAASPARPDWRYNLFNFKLKSVSADISRLAEPSSHPVREEEIEKLIIDDKVSSIPPEWSTLIGRDPRDTLLSLVEPYLKAYKMGAFCAFRCASMDGIYYNRRPYAIKTH